jgi:S-DNA-T family DNA segregation ATPase FtsK/SpoIIIE
VAKKATQRRQPKQGPKKAVAGTDSADRRPRARMRKEIAGICLFFMVVFTLVSLLSYSPLDPSLSTAAGGTKVHNLFGVMGAYFAGGLIDLFGLGAFWIPLLLLISSLQFFSKQSTAAMVATAMGGLLLVVATGGLLSLKQHSYEIFGSQFSSGGVTGIPIETFLVRYSNMAGAAIILAALFLVGFILTTRFSLVVFTGRLIGFIRVAVDRAQTEYLKRQERKEKARRRQQQKKEIVIQKPRPVKIQPPAIKPISEAPVPRQEEFNFMREDKGFQLPSAKLLDDNEEKPTLADRENLRMQSKLLEKKLDDFSVNGQVVTISPGPVITTFEYAPAPGVKINRIVSLTDDLALALRATSIRIVAPIPGKAVIGIEIPNPERQIVRFRGIVVSSEFEKSRSKLTMCLGRDIVGNPVVADLTRMPHLLIAGATGTGKSVGLNAMICSFLYKSSPEEVKMIMIDPKRIELSLYDGIPHLIAPVVTDVKKATNALHWAVREMERRYELLSEKKVRNINQYNNKVDKEIETGAEEPPERLPLITIVIDELADLMMVASRDVEAALTRLAQMARAAGIHLILATQRPSVDVLTGIIKANFPTRLTFQVSSKTDSRTIIDANGAENLLGAGDMLFMPPGTGKLQRIHGAYISEAELVRVTDFVKGQGKPAYDKEVVKAVPREKEAEEEIEHDERYDDAVALVTQTRQASISMLQRHLRVGYNRAARMIEVMEKEGIVGPSDGVKTREVLVRGYEDIP